MITKKILVDLINKIGLVIIILAASKFYSPNPLVIGIGVIIGVFFFFIPNE